MTHSTTLAAAFSAVAILITHAAQADTPATQCAFTPYVGICSQGCDEDANMASGVDARALILSTLPAGKTIQNEAGPTAHTLQHNTPNS